MTSTTYRVAGATGLAGAARGGAIAAGGVS